MTMISLAAVACALALSTCAAAQERMLSKQVAVKAPLDAVWNAWTTTEGVKTFFAPDALPEARAQRTGGEWDKAYDYFDKAWDTVLGNLQQRFVTGPKDRTVWLARMKAYSEKK